MAGWRFYAQRLLGGAWLDRDLDLMNVEMSWELSGPGELTATVDETLAKAMAPDGLLILREWSTAIYAEKDGEIRWGGILHSSGGSDNRSRTISCTGFAGYPKGRVYGGEYRLWEADPFDVVRTIWTFVQKDSYAKIGVTVDSGKSGYKLGDPVKGTKPARGDYATAALYDAAVVEWTNYSGEPYELAWWNTTDCGDEINNVMQESGADYTEVHTWANDDQQVVNHRIKLGNPLGSRRTDLRFVEGENVIVPPVIERNGEEYANQIQALGAGEERFMLRKEVGQMEDGVLRRDKVVSGKDVMSYARLEKMARDELIIATDILAFDEFQVLDHPHAHLGSFQLGDQIRVQTFSGYQSLDRWVKIVGYKISLANSDIITMNVTRIL